MSQKRITALALLVLSLLIGGCGSSESTISTTTASKEVPVALHIRHPQSAEVFFLVALDNMNQEEEANALVTATYWRRTPTSDPRLHVVVQTAGSFKGFGRPLSGGFTYTPQRSVLEYEGQSYEVDPSELRGEAACRRALEAVDLSPLTESSSEKVSLTGVGRELTRVGRGGINLSWATKELRQLVEGSACAAQFQSIPLIQMAVDAATGAVDEYELLPEGETWIGIHSGYRGFFTRLYLLPPGAEGNKYKGSYKGLFEVVVKSVNEVEEIPVPPPGKPLSALVEKLGREEVKAFQAGAIGIAGLLRAAASR